MAEIGVADVGPVARLRQLADAVLFSYSQLLFTRQRTVGALLFAATWLQPRLGLLGLGAVLLALLVVRLARFSDQAAAQGSYGFNPLLVALALGEFLEPSPGAVALTAVAVVTVVFLQTALEAAAGYFLNLPVLSLPFVLVTFLALSAVPMLTSVEPARWAVAFDAGEGLWLPGFLSGYLRALGAILFSPHLLTGLLVFGALLVFSRIAVLLSLVGYAVAFAVVSQTSFATQLGPLSVGYNAVLIAVALGGIWFVPQRSAFAFAALGAALTAFVGLATTVLLLPARLPVLVLPFNLALLFSLYAMRQRVRDQCPRSVDFPSGTPEANLLHFRTRLERFGSNVAVRFALPFSGRWTVTQGPGGGPTHQGPWAHAWDFEVLDASQQRHAGSGTGLKDYYCYRLPVLAVADGTVVKVARDLPDNPIGQRNPTDNWGNLVLLQHRPGLLSLVAHLAPGTIEVAEGQFVRQGTRLGLCGNSGRSFVPHLHLQFQSTSRVGDPTLAVELNDVVLECADRARLSRAALPAQGDAIRNLERREEVAALLQFPLGTRLRFEHQDGRRETATSCIDLFSNLYLESDDGSRLYYEGQGRQFLVFDYLGTRRSALYLLYAALPRLPYEHPRGLSWDDVLSRRRFRPRALGWLVDFVDPFLSIHGLAVDLTARLDGSDLVVCGRGRLSRRAVETYARLVPGRGPVELRLTIGTEARSATLHEVEHESQGLLGAADSADALDVARERTG